MDSVASRYAIALLSVARDNNQIKEYNSEVESIINIILNNKGFSLQKLIAESVSSISSEIKQSYSPIESSFTRNPSRRLVFAFICVLFLDKNKCNAQSATK